MRGDDRGLAQVAASVADGASVDWNAAEAKAGPSERRLIRHLRLVESISSVYRTLPADADDDLAEPLAQPAGPQWGHLVLLDRIGEGTSCEVHRAWDSALHREVALKLFNDDGLDSRRRRSRMLEEARRLARVRHQHVVQVYGAEEHGDRVGLWMELVVGESLDQTIRTRGPLGAAEAATIGQQLCAALAAVHAAGLLHRDVKAQNVLRESGGRIVLMDFGTGEELSTNSGTSRLVGTPLYLAPEIFRGRAASVQSDLYSLGVLLFYLVTGEFPVTARSMEQLARAHESGASRRLRDLRPDLPAGFVNAVERALDPSPERRPRSAGDLETALRQVHDSGVAVEAPPRPAWQQWRRVLPAVAALVVLIAAALIWSRPGSAPDSTRIAVLPVVPASSEPDAPQMVEALTDRLAATLGEIDSLQVTDPASVRRVADGRSPVQLAAALSVDAVVQSTVKLLGGENGGPRRAQVDVKLMAAGSGRTLWAETFVRDIGDLRSLHAAIARGVAGTVRAGVSPSVARRLDRVEVTTQGAAEAYFQGLYHLKQLSADHTRLAVKAFERAIELDPLYAPAHAALAQSYVDLGVLGAMTHAEARALAAVRIERALSLDGESSEARAVNADLKFFYNWDWRAADEEYQRAIMANGSSARALSQYARYLAGAGRLDEALEYATRSFELNPLSSSAASTVALVHLFRRDAPAALRAVDEALKRDPDSSGVHIIRSRILAASNALDEAIVAAERAIAQAGPQAPPGWRAHLISLRARRQSADEGAEAIRRLSEELRSRNQRMGPVHYAYMYLGLGSSEEALAYLERAADERSPDVLWLAVDPRVDELRGEPRFERVLERIGSR